MGLIGAKINMAALAIMNIKPIKVLLDTASGGGSVSSDDITSPMAKLISLVFTIFQVGGVIMIAFGVFNFVSNMDGHDTSVKIRSALMIGGGILLCLIKLVIKSLGISGIDNLIT